MCVAFGAREVYEFIFSKDEAALDVHEINKRTVSDFCSVLEREITAHAAESPHYQYVHFALDRQSMEAFFQTNRDRFLDFGSTVMFTADCTTSVARAIESKYDDDIVTRALRKARTDVREKVASAS